MQHPLFNIALLMSRHYEFRLIREEMMKMTRRIGVPSTTPKLTCFVFSVHHQRISFFKNDTWQGSALVPPSVYHTYTIPLVNNESLHCNFRQP